MKEELTTLMHCEFIGKEESLEDLKVMAVFAQLKRGISLDKALSNNDISKEYYLSNVDRIIYGKKLI